MYKNNNFQQFEIYKADTKCIFFLHLTRCDLDLGGSNPIAVLCTSSHDGDHLCKVISKFLQRFKSNEVDTKCSFQYLAFQCDLDLGVATKLLRSAHRLKMVITCAK
jgi:hypothetical protein